MPNNVFNIVISATDNATKTVRKVNQAMDRLMNPFNQVGKSFKSLGRELGFEKIGKNLSAIGRQAKGAASSIGSVVAPLAAITGVGTVAGIVALADSWANLGRSITYSAQNIGTSTGQLQSFQGAAKLAGLSSDAMATSLQTLGDTMEDALYGRNQQALMLFNRLGVGIKRTKDGAIDAAGEFKALSAAIYRLPNAQVQNLAAGQFGLTALLPLIRQGPAAFDKLQAKARELGLVMDGPALKSANEFASSLSSLKASGEGLRNSIGNAIIPAIKPLVDQLGSWISANRELISTKIGQWAKDFGEWVKQVDWKKVGDDIGSIVSGAANLVDKLGGLKGAAIATGVVLGAGFVGNTVMLLANLLKLGVGVGGLIAKFTGLEAAAKAAGAASALSSGSALGVLGKLGLAGAAAGAGWYIGSKISNAMDGTAVGDRFAHYNTAAIGKLLGLVGDRDNVFSRAAANDPYSQQKNSTPSVDAGLSRRVLGFFQQQGWTQAQAAGIAANLIKESGLRSGAIGDNGTAYGVGQWHPDRQAAFARWSGHPIQGSSLDDQLKFVQFELTGGGEQAAGNRLRSARTAQEAGDTVSRYYERPAAADKEAASRGSLADQLVAPGSPSRNDDVTAQPEKPRAPSGPYSQEAPAAPSGSVHVEVTVKGVAPNSQVKVTPKGDVTASARIGYSAVGGMA